MWTVTSDRTPWPLGATVKGSQLRGCNIDALVAGGHLAPAPTAKRRPVEPAPVPADEPKE